MAIANIQIRSTTHEHVYRADVPQSNGAHERSPAQMLSVIDGSSCVDKHGGYLGILGVENRCNRGVRLSNAVKRIRIGAACQKQADNVAAVEANVYGDAQRGSTLHLSIFKTSIQIFIRDLS